MGPRFHGLGFDAKYRRSDNDVPNCGRLHRGEWKLWLIVCCKDRMLTTVEACESVRRSSIFFLDGLDVLLHVERVSWKWLRPPFPDTVPHSLTIVCRVERRDTYSSILGFKRYIAPVGLGADFLGILLGFVDTWHSGVRGT